MIRVKPTNPDAIIRDPHTKRVLPAEGAEVPENNFWTRRISAGEVVLVEDAPAHAPVASLTTRGGK